VMSKFKTSKVSMALLLAGALGAPVMNAAAAAEDAKGHLGFVAQADLEYGGDNVVTIIFTNGDTQKIKAGQGATLSLGGHYKPAASHWDFSATIGYKFVTNASSNSDLNIHRMVYKVLGEYRFDNNWWLTAGPVMHSGTKLDGDGFVPDVKFKSSTGAQVGVGWKWVGLTYTTMKYKGPFPGSVDANAIGVSFAGKF
jgi:hypothetical protein